LIITLTGRQCRWPDDRCSARYLLRYPPRTALARFIRFRHPGRDCPADNRRPRPPL